MTVQLVKMQRAKCIFLLNWFFYYFYAQNWPSPPMIKTLLLLTPVYVTLFWFLLLVINRPIGQKPKRFLGVFMGASFVVYVSHFLFFSPLPHLYYWVDPFYQYASLLVYPLYFIYIRLLMVEANFSLRTSGLFLIAPTLIFLLYITGFILTPEPIIKAWIYDRTVYPDDHGIQFMNVIKSIIPYVFIIQALWVMITSFILINTYRDKAEQYYSDLQDSRINSILLLNTTLVVCSLTSIILSALGKDFFKQEVTAFAIPSAIFSSALFLIGWLGYRQKSINPSYEMPTNTMLPMDELPPIKQQLILNRIVILFETEKVFQNTHLTIQDVALAVGTNRTYVSAIINQTYTMNFCRFVNEYRLKALEKLLRGNVDQTFPMLAEHCGFGSVDSMKRAVKAKTGGTITEWRQSLQKG